MNPKNISINGRNIGRLFLYLDFDSSSDQYEFVTKISSRVKPSMKYGYAGFSRRGYLINKLEDVLFGGDKKVKIIKFKIDEAKFQKIVLDSLKLSYKKLPIDSIDIFVFPHFNKFIKDNMGGTTGSVIWRNSMILFVNPVKGWERYLKGSVVHEYNHSVGFKYHKWDTLLTKILLEGMAEVFLEEVNPNSPLIIGKTLNLKKSKKYFKILEKHLSSMDDKIYNEVFYDNKKYPLWSGYSIGYWIVKEFRKKNPKMSWDMIIKLKPEIILSKSGYKK